jgi:hypothetical protein
MADFASNIARLRAVAAAGLPLPADVAAWVLELAEGQAPAALLRRRRDALLRQAAQQIEAATAAERAERIARELERIARSPVARPSSDPLRQVLTEVRQLGRPVGRRQLQRILAKTR